MPGGLDLFSVQEEIKQYVTANIPFFVTTGGVPDASSVRQINGLVEPYVILRFSDSMPSSNDRSFGGPRLDGMYGYVDALCVAGGEDDTLARRLGSDVGKNLLGFKPYNAGTLGKGYGGGSFYIAGENSKPLFWVGIVSFRFTTNSENVGA